MVALDALLREGSVSGAAASLNMQVSAVSRLLAELRDLYGDPILVRTGNGMRPTPFAESLRLRLRRLANEAELLASAGAPMQASAPEAAQVGSEWAVAGAASVVPLAVTSDDQLIASPTPVGIANRIAEIGDNADPHLRLARYIATTGPGAGQSRPLTFDEARDAMSIILDGHADPVQIGGLLIPIQYRGPAATELAGFATAVRDSLTGVPRNMAVPDLDWPAYVSPRIRSAPWFIHAAKLIAANGYSVLLHGHYGRGPESGKLEAAAADADIPVCATVAEVDAALRGRRIAYAPIAALLPQVGSILGLHSLFGMRNPLNAAVNMVNPLGADATIVGASQTSRRDLYREVAKVMNLANIAVVGSVRDIAEMPAGKATKIYTLLAGVERDIMVGARKSVKTGVSGLMTQREYWKAVWTGAARDDGAEATIVLTAAVALLALAKRSEASFEECLAAAQDMWSARSRR